MFLGHVLNKEGIKPTHDKIEAVLNFVQPKSAKEVKSFMGLVNFVGKFNPHMGTYTEPLRKLLKKNARFLWGMEQEKAFGRLKELLTVAPTLGYFDAAAPTYLVADASPFGIGAILLQKQDKTVKIIRSYASKSLTDQERKFSQTEKEALALVWGVERFRMYLYGKRFTLLTDHKPLKFIFSPRSKPCPRIERWTSRLLSFTFEVQYIEGSKNIADPLSRLLPNNNDKPFWRQTEEYLYGVALVAVPKALKLQDFIEATKSDLVLQRVGRCLISGRWSRDLHHFECIKHEISEWNGIFLRGTRIIVPESLQETVLLLAHEGHPGMTSMKRKLRTKVWWPKLESAVEKKVTHCLPCQQVALPPAPAEMKRRELPKAAWLEIAMDFKGPLRSGEQLLVVTDYYSRFIEVEVMHTISAQYVIDRLKVLFSRYSLPESITLDNGKQFASKEFQGFCQMQGIKLFFSPPYWPQANGLVERHNRCISKILRIAEAGKTSWKSELQDFLFQYRTTPHSTTGASPAELFFGRQLRDKIPSLDTDAKTRGDIADADKSAKFRGKQYADAKRRAEKKQFNEGDVVLRKRDFLPTKDTPNYLPTKYQVVRRCGNSLTVKSPEGQQITRNVAFFKSYPPLGNQSNQEDIQWEVLEGDFGSTARNSTTTVGLPIAASTPCSQTSTPRTTTAEFGTPTGPAASAVAPTTQDGRPQRLRRVPFWHKDYQVNNGEV